MILTVTTTTVTTIVTLTATGASLGMIVTILLISLLGTQEVAKVGSHHMMTTLGKNLNVSVLPLLILFSLIVIFKAAEAIV